MRDNKRNSKTGDWLITIGLLLIAAALFLAGENIWDISRARIASQAVIEELLPVIEEEIEEKSMSVTEEEKEKDAPKKSVMLPVIPDYVLNPDMEMPTEQIDGNDYIGILSVSDIDLLLPVMESWSYTNLKISPCRYTGTAYKKNFVICAHNYESHFGNLKYLDVGSVILFSDMDGNEFCYEVVEVETLQPTAIEDMISGDWDLTLFTCTVGGAARVTVRCMLQESGI